MSYAISIPKAPNTKWKITILNYALNLHMTKYEISALGIIFPNFPFPFEEFHFFPVTQTWKPLKQFNTFYI